MPRSFPFLIGLTMALLLSACGRSLPPPPAKPAMDGVGPDIVAVVDNAHRASERSDGDIPSRARLGRVYHANSYPNEARQVYEQVLDVMPGHGPTLYLLAMLEQEQGNQAQADVLLAQAIDSTPANLVMRLRQGMWALDAGDGEMVERVLGPLRDSNPQHPGVRVLDARHAIAFDQPDRAVQILSPMVKSAQSHPYWRHLLGRAHRQLGNEREAYRLLSIGSPTPPPMQDPYMQELLKEKRGFNPAFKRAAAMLARGNTEGAIEVYERLLSNYPDRTATLLNAISQAHFKASDPAAAMAALDRALAHDPDDAESHINYSVLLAREQPAEALRWARTARTIDPDNPLAHDRIARLQLAQGNPTEALASADEAIRLGSVEPSLQFVRGAALMQLSRPQEAADALQQVVAVRPMNESARMLFVEACMLQGRRDDAASALEQGLILRPGHRPYLDRLRAILEPAPPAAPTGGAAP